MCVAWTAGRPLLLPETIEDYVSPENPVRFIDAFVASLDLHALGFARAIAAYTGRPAYEPGLLLRLYLYGYLHRLRSSRQLERECHRNTATWNSSGLCAGSHPSQDHRRLEAMAARVKAHPEKMRGRKALVEHPFGTIKRWFGYTYFLVKGLEKVRGEWTLITLSYNLKRVLNLVSFPRTDEGGAGKNGGRRLNERAGAFF
jgi:hypothetical protein